MCCIYLTRKISTIFHIHSWKLLLSLDIYENVILAEGVLGRRVSSTGWFTTKSSNIEHSRVFLQHVAATSCVNFPKLQSIESKTNSQIEPFMNQELFSPFLFMVYVILITIFLLKFNLNPQNRFIADKCFETHWFRNFWN